MMKAGTSVIRNANIGCSLCNTASSAQQTTGTGNGASSALLQPNRIAGRPLDSSSGNDNAAGGETASAQSEIATIARFWLAKFALALRWEVNEDSDDSQFSRSSVMCLGSAFS